MIHLRTTGNVGEKRKEINGQSRVGAKRYKLLNSPGSNEELMQVFSAKACMNCEILTDIDLACNHKSRYTLNTQILSHTHACTLHCGHTDTHTPSRQPWKVLRQPGPLLNNNTLMTVKTGCCVTGPLRCCNLEGWGLGGVGVGGSASCVSF